MHTQVANIRLCTYKSTQHKRQTIAVGSISLSLFPSLQSTGWPTSPPSQSQGLKWPHPLHFFIYFQTFGKTKIQMPTRLTRKNSLEICHYPTDGREEVVSGEYMSTLQTHRYVYNAAWEESTSWMVWQHKLVVFSSQIESIHFNE